MTEQALRVTLEYALMKQTDNCDTPGNDYFQ